MPTNECIPFFEPSDRPTGYCVAAVTGKRFVKIANTPSGGLAGTENMQITPAVAATDNVIGVAGYDGAIGDQVPVLCNGMTVPVTVGAAVTAGTKVTSDAQGRAIPYVAGGTIGTDPQPVGVAVEDQATVGNDCAIKLFI